MNQPTSIALAPGQKPYLFTVDEVLAMVKAGILPEQRGLELIEGVLVEMAPIGPEHAAETSIIAREFTLRLGAGAIVRTQSPVQLNARSLPEPDIAVVQNRRDHYRAAHPTPADTFLIIEISDTTLAFDRGRKLALYASSGIAEVWIVDIEGKAVEVYRAPIGDHYTQLTTHHAPAQIACASLPEAKLNLSDLFG
jgi:Uma2 family endonuclease